MRNLWQKVSFQSFQSCIQLDGRSLFLKLQFLQTGDAFAKIFPNVFVAKEVILSIAICDMPEDFPIVGISNFCTNIIEADAFELINMCVGICGQNLSEILIFVGIHPFAQKQKEIFLPSFISSH